VRASADRAGPRASARGRPRRPGRCLGTRPALSARTEVIV